jgi:hypothetical protein
VRRQLATERKLFGLWRRRRQRKSWDEEGNVIRAGENAAAAQHANRGILLYDKLKTTVGPINDLLDRAAQ